MKFIKAQLNENYVYVNAKMIRTIEPANYKNAKSRITLESDEFEVWSEQTPEEIINEIAEVEYYETFKI